MYITAEEITKIGTIGARFVGMSKRFLPQCGDMEQFILYVKELHLIRKTELELLKKRSAEIRERKDANDASHCNLVRFFQYKNVLAEFSDFWRQYHSYLFSDRDKNDLAKAYASQPLIKHIDFGVHVYTTPRSRGNKLLEELENNLETVRITFANGEMLDIPDLNQPDISQQEWQHIEEAHQRHFRDRMVPVLSFK